jgi:hypothetical protein
LNMKKVRDQARKENTATKGKAKGKAKAVKQFAADAVDHVVAAKNAVSKKAVEVKDSIVHSTQTIKADTKAAFKKSDHTR